MKTPYHIGIIVDGNRRWAKNLNLPSLEGHRRGFENVKNITKRAWNQGVKIITVYCFSTENWARPKREIKYLMSLFKNALSDRNIDNYDKQGVKIKIIGQKDRFPLDVQKRMAKAETDTQTNTKGILNLALSYGGRPEIIEAVKKIVRDNIKPEDISEDTINQYLWTAGLPNPDLIIRSGGEQRLSNFLTWQSSYSELYFSNKYWPDFKERDLDEALIEFSKREQRFGK